MAVTNYYADALISGAVSTSANALSSTTGTWTSDTGNTPWTARFSMANPTGTLTGTQVFTVRIRKENGQSGTPSVVVTVMTEDGVTSYANSGSVNVTSGTGQDVVVNVPAASIANANVVAVEVAVTAAGGSPGARSSAQIDYIQWAATTVDNITKNGADSGTLSATESSSLVVQVAKVGADSGTLSATESSSKTTLTEGPQPTFVQHSDGSSITVTTDVSAGILSVQQGDIVIVSTYIANSSTSSLSSPPVDNNGTVTTFTPLFTDDPNSALLGELRAWYGTAQSTGNVSVTTSWTGNQAATVTYVAALRGARTPVTQYTADTDSSYTKTTANPVIISVSIARNNTQDPSLNVVTPSGATELATPRQVFVSGNITQYASAWGSIGSGSLGYGVATGDGSELHNLIIEVPAAYTAGTSDPKSGADTGTLSATESSSLSVSATLSRSDSGTFSATEASTLVKNIAVADSGTLSSTESRALDSTSARADSGTFSATESSSVLKTFNVSDAGTLSATESSTVVVTVTRTDSGTISATESSSNAVSSTRTDSGTLSATESSSLFKDIGSSDAGTLSATESSSSAVSSSRSDTGTFSATEASVLVVTVSRADSGTLSATETSTSALSSNRTDSGTVSAVESSESVLSSAVSDSGTLSATESSSVEIGGSFSLDRADSGTLSATESSSIAPTIDVADGGTLSATEQSQVNKDIALSDTGTLSATEASTVFKAIDVSDSGTLSATETAFVFNDRPGADSGVLSATESSSLVITGTIDKVGADGGTLSALEESSLGVQVSGADSGTFISTEAASASGTGNRADAGTLSVTEQAQIDVNLTVAPSDSGVLSATESSSVVATNSQTTVHAWTGTQMVDVVMYRWNGSGWDALEFKHWNGSNFS